MHNYKYLQIPILIILSVVTWEGHRYLLKIWHYSLAIYNLSHHQLLTGYPAEVSTILDSPFTGIVNTTSIHIGCEGGGGQVATKRQAKATSALKTDKWHPLLSFLPPHNTQSS